MTTRMVKGSVKWARELPGRPACIPAGRPRGVKALGVRYEKALAKALGPKVRHGVWFEYGDAEGRWFCQVDFLLPWQDGVLVGEAKLTWTFAGHKQIEGLYVPVLAKAYANVLRPIGGFVICKAITRETRREVHRIVDNLSTAYAFAAEGRRVVLQWLPKTPIGAERSIRSALPDLSTEFGLDLGPGPC